MSPDQLDQDGLRPVLPEDIDWEPFPAFPPAARLAVGVGRPLEPGPYVVRVKLPSGVGEQFDEGKLAAYPAGCRPDPARRNPSFPLGQIR